MQLRKSHYETEREETEKKTCFSPEVKRERKSFRNELPLAAQAVVEMPMTCCGKKCRLMIACMRASTTEIAMHFLKRGRQSSSSSSSRKSSDEKSATDFEVRQRKN